MSIDANDIANFFVPDGYRILRPGEYVKAGDQIWINTQTRFMTIADTGQKWSRVTEYDVIIRKINKI